MNTNLIIAMPAQQEISTVAPEASGAIEAGVDGTAPAIKLADKFDSILHTQLQEGDQGSPEDALKLLASTMNTTEAVAKSAPQAEPLTAIKALTIAATAATEDPIALVAPTVQLEPAALVAPTAQLEAAALLESGLAPDSASPKGSVVAPDLAILLTPPDSPAPLRNPVAADAVIAAKPDIELDVNSTELTQISRAITAGNEQNPTITVAEQANKLLESNKITHTEINLEAAKNAAPIEIATVDASKASPIGLAGLETQLNKHTQLSKNSPVAGSPATRADEVVLSSRQALSVEEVSVTDSEQTQWSGKLAPPRGNTLPGNLPFITNPDGKISLVENVSDFVNKAVLQNQQLSQASEVKPILQQAAQPEASATISNIATLLGAEKANAGRNPGAFNVESGNSFVIQSPAGSTDWNNQVGDRIRWMGRVNISSAELKLHPAELGTVEIKISTEDDQTKVSFLTGTAAAKEVIEASLPRLRDLLSSSGLQLEQSDVSQKDLSENRADQQDTNTADTGKSDTSGVAEEPALLVRQNSLNQIDHYV